MNSIDDTKRLLLRIMDMMEQQFGPNSEIVLHDLALPFEHTIIDIRNGHISGRSVGDGGTNTGLEVLRGTVKDGDRYNYITYLKSSRILRSSEIYVCDEQGNPVIAMCVNTDITDAIRFEDYLHKMNRFARTEAERQEPEYFPTNIQDLLNYLISESQKIVNVPVEEMGKDEKIEFLRLLDQKGAFLVTKSSDKICEYLGISRFTLYKYLDIIRSEKEGDETEEAPK